MTYKIGYPNSWKRHVQIAVGSLQRKKRAYILEIAIPNVYAVHFNDPTAIYMSFVGRFQNLYIDMLLTISNT
jgi:hypothetical protein